MNLRDLYASFPLTAKWSLPERFSETVGVGNLNIEVCGFSSRAETGFVVTGSAGVVGGQPDARAYFEFLERASIIEAEFSNQPSFQVYDENRRPLITVSRTHVFPESPSPDRWRYAKSNGVASHTDWASACRSAAYELIERDVILRSWYGRVAGERSDHPFPHLTHVADLYDVTAFHLMPCQMIGFSETVHTAVVVGMPKAGENPTIMGFGSASSKAQALEKAESECLQRLGFLWGQPIETDSAIAFSPSAEFHMEYFLRAEGQKALETWLSRSSPLDCSPFAPRSIRFVDLTPDHLRGSVVVVKALCDETIPLTFGHPDLMPTSDLDPDFLIHPVS